ncbi:RNA polymerase Rpc34 subunit [Xylariaceae sp. FL1019]|nr:RNA polymerase Rpc34 subunit [Xylariaceae sp. FL1019]
MDEQQTILLKTQLYEACKAAASSHEIKLFTQDDLINLDVVPPKDIKKLTDLIQMLTRERFFAPVAAQSGLAWRLRTEDEVAKFKQISSPDQLLVYEMIDAVHRDGIWQQEIKRKLNIQDNALRKAIKELETKRLISPMTHVDSSAKKMWIRYDLKPSERATGGPWFTDTLFDEALVISLQGAIINICKNRGSYLSKGERGARSVSPVLPKKGVINGSSSAAALKSKKRPADAMSTDDSPAARVRKHVRLPLPAGYMEYPTSAEITQMILRAGITKGQPLNEENVQHLLNILMWDNRIEEIRMGARVGYRASRITKHNPSLEVKYGDEDLWEARSNGLTTVPCGKCPVFDLCEEGGPVWAGGCEYYDRWLT